MKHFGVCFEVPARFRQGEDKDSKLFLFPSLGEQGLVRLLTIVQLFLTPNSEAQVYY